MRKTIHKCIWVWDFDKEEKWLNEMAAKGLALVSVGFCKYEFEDCEPGEYKICMQMLEKNVSNPESQKYMEFIEGTGAEHIGTFKNWVYFRKKTSDGHFELFSDNESRVRYLKRITNFVIVVTVLNILVGAYNVFLACTFVSPVNFLGLINILIGILGIAGMIRLIKKRRRLEQESQLFE